MPFTSLYITPPSFDNLLLASDGDLLTGLHFIDSQKAEEHLWEGEKVDLPIFGRRGAGSTSTSRGISPISRHGTNWRT